MGPVTRGTQDISAVALRDFPAAEAALVHAKRLHPEESSAYLYLGETYSETKRFPLAIGRAFSGSHNADYWPDFGVTPDAPLHPGSDLYALTKFLGGEVMRVFAEQHGLPLFQSRTPRKLCVKRIALRQSAARQP